MLAAMRQQLIPQVLGQELHVYLLLAVVGFGGAQNDAAIQGQCLKEEGAAFAVFVGEECADAGPETLLAFFPGVAHGVGEVGRALSTRSSWPGVARFSWSFPLVIVSVWHINRLLRADQQPEIIGRMQPAIDLARARDLLGGQALGSMKGRGCDRGHFAQAKARARRTPLRLGWLPSSCRPDDGEAYNMVKSHQPGSGRTRVARSAA